MLEPWDRSQAAEMAAFLSGEQWPFHAGGTPTVAAVLDRVAAGGYDGADVRTCWVVAGGERVGLVRMYELADETAEFDLRLRAAARGRGLGTAAVRELTGTLFADLPGLVRIEATTRADNVAMRRVLTRCGYLQESRYRLAWPTADGRRLDSLGFAVLRPGLATDLPWLLHVRVNVSDLARSVAWYEALLGVPAEAHRPLGAPADVHFQAGPAQLGLSVLAPRPGGARLDLTVADVAARWAALRDRVDVLEPLHETPYGTRRFTVRDPDGNEIGIVDH